MTDFTKIFKTFSNTKYLHGGQHAMLRNLSEDECQSIKDNLSDNVVNAVLNYYDSILYRKQRLNRLKEYRERCFDFMKPRLDYIPMMRKQQWMQDNLNRAHVSEKTALKELYVAVYERGPTR
jgi:hypothetical protein